MSPRPHPPDRSPRLPAPRILLHCHDSYGLGHLRRTLTIAGALRERFPESRILITSGSPCATHFPLPDGVDVVKLPAVSKSAGGSYRPRTLGGSLESLVDLRRRIVLEVFRGFEPDVVIVDHQVLGLCGELEPALGEARRRGARTLLGIRDVIDEPDVVAREWGEPAVRRALDGLYDRVCVYGSPQVFDPRVEYPIPPELRRLVEFTGYVVRAAGRPPGRAVPSLEPRVLVTVGGGEDGTTRIQTYLDMVSSAKVPWDSTIVLGPLFPAKEARRIKRAARLVDGVEVHGFHSDVPRLLAQSDAVVSMAGYNSVAEILQSGRPAVLWARSFPRREQHIRARRLATLGLARSVEEPDPRLLRAAVEAALGEGRRSDCPLPLDGHERVCDVVGSLLQPALATGNGRAAR
jgi:predicted glycosyltransferase